MNRIIYPPKRPRNILVFDVETNGLLPKKKRGCLIEPNIEKCPYILQLSYAIYDLEKYEIVETYNAYIKVAEDVEISEFITSLNGINREICETKGVPIMDALKQFYKGYMKCDCIIAHNINFDEKMILVEIERNREYILEYAPYCILIFNEDYEKMNSVEKYCTMREGTELCNINFKKNYENDKIEKINKPRKSPPPSRKPPSKKFPKLSELYLKLFENTDIPINLHNSMVDVLVCLSCYLKMCHTITHDYTKDIVTGFSCAITV